jgi:hypothetical protein
VAENANQITSHLQAPGRLLVGQCSNDASRMICAYTGVPDRYRGYIHDPVASRTGSVVFSLAPTHKVFAAQKQEVRLNISVEVDPDEVSQDEELGIRDIQDRSGLLEVEIGDSTLERAIREFEIWTM